MSSIHNIPGSRTPANLLSDTEALLHPLHDAVAREGAGAGGLRPAADEEQAMQRLAEALSRIL